MDHINLWVSHGLSPENDAFGGMEKEDKKRVKIIRKTTRIGRFVN